MSTQPRAAAAEQPREDAWNFSFTTSKVCLKRSRLVRSIFAIASLSWLDATPRGPSSGRRGSRSRLRQLGVLLDGGEVDLPHPLQLCPQLLELLLLARPPAGRRGGSGAAPRRARSGAARGSARTRCSSSSASDRSRRVICAEPLGDAVQPRPLVAEAGLVGVHPRRRSPRRGPPAASSSLAVSSASRCSLPAWPSSAAEIRPCSSSRRIAACARASRARDWRSASSATPAATSASDARAASARSACEATFTRRAISSWPCASAERCSPSSLLEARGRVPRARRARPARGLTLRGLTPRPGPPGRGPPPARPSRAPAG